MVDIGPALRKMAWGYAGDVHAAQSKTVATPMVILGVDITGPRIQAAPVGS